MGTEPVLPIGPSRDGHLSQKFEELSCWQFVLPFLPSAPVFVPPVWFLCLVTFPCLPGFFGWTVSTWRSVQGQLPIHLCCPAAPV